MLKQTDKTLVQLDRLKKIGVSLAIDDFGTGYSNLSYLTRFNVDVLKIDRSFTYKIDHCEEDLAIVKAIITMANILGLITVAEGVENKDIWKVLQSLGCDLGQGFYWSKPIPEQEYNQTYFDKVVIEPTPVH